MAHHTLTFRLWQARRPVDKSHTAVVLANESSPLGNVVAYCTCGTPSSRHLRGCPARGRRCHAARQSDTVPRCFPKLLFSRVYWKQPWRITPGVVALFAVILLGFWGAWCVHNHSPPCSAYVNHDEPWCKEQIRREIEEFNRRCPTATPDAGGVIRTQAGYAYGPDGPFRCR